MRRKWRYDPDSSEWIDKSMPVTTKAYQDGRYLTLLGADTYLYTACYPPSQGKRVSSFTVYSTMKRDTDAETNL